MEAIINKVQEDYLAYSDEIGDCQFSVESHPTMSNKLVVFIKGEIKTIHEEGLYKIEFTFTEKYPEEKPIGKFISPLPYHCNIGNSGSICLDYYNNWGKNSKKGNFNSLLEAICYLISNSNPLSSFRDEIGKEQIENYEKYVVNVKTQALVCKKAFSYVQI